jgi:hypothetical protein
METATSIELFVEILDRYVYYFDQQNESVSQSAFFPCCMRPNIPVGNDQVPQWFDRIDPLQSRWEPAGFGVHRNQSKALSSDAREYPK